MYQAPINIIILKELKVSIKFYQILPMSAVGVIIHSSPSFQSVLILVSRTDSSLAWSRKGYWRRLYLALRVLAHDDIL